MPELVAGFHSLVGLAAVFVAIAAFLNPAAFNLGNIGNIKLASLIEMSIGAAVGAITFSGSIIAFLKLRGIMSGAPITFSGQHILNKLPVSASSLYAKNMFNFVENLFDKENKKLNINLEDEIIEKTLIK